MTDSIPISSVIVLPDRQRKFMDPAHIASLAESIGRLGLIHPIVLDEDNALIAGECRLEAHKLLRLTSIPFRRMSDLSAFDRKSIELEENVKRKNLSWQEECEALAELHALHLSVDPDWTQEQTAQIVGYAQQEVSRKLAVAVELAAGNEAIASADKLSVAHNMVQRTNERKRATAIASIAPTLAIATETEVPEPQIVAPPIINCSFHDWQQAYDGQKFNLIHCDFPYGINVADAPRQNSAIKDYYEDSPDIYWSLLDRLGLAMGNVVDDSAHLIFWFDMGYYSQTLSALRAMGWTVAAHPLIWHKLDNSGVAPDPQRLPRRTYETAFFAHRGDRKLTQSGTRSNSFGFPGRRAEDAHVSEKPVPMLQHFMSMVCDEYSTVLDPTCGSGNAIKVARDLGATSFLGLEIDPQFFADTCRRWNDE